MDISLEIGYIKSTVNWVPYESKVKRLMDKIFFYDLLIKKKKRNRRNMEGETSQKLIKFGWL